MHDSQTPAERMADAFLAYMASGGTVAAVVHEESAAVTYSITDAGITAALVERRGRGALHADGI